MIGSHLPISAYPAQDPARIEAHYRMVAFVSVASTVICMFVCSTMITILVSHVQLVDEKLQEEIDFCMVGAFGASFLPQHHSRLLHRQLLKTVKQTVNLSPSIHSVAKRDLNDDIAKNATGRWLFGTYYDLFIRNKTFKFESDDFNTTDSDGLLSSMSGFLREMKREDPRERVKDKTDDNVSTIPEQGISRENNLAERGQKAGETWIERNLAERDLASLEIPQRLVSFYAFKESQFRNRATDDDDRSPATAPETSTGRAALIQGSCCTCQQGKPGPVGPSGSDGADGKDGEAGRKGSEGFDSVLMIASRSTRPLCGTCVPGPAGKQGEMGPKGGKGPQGNPGPADLASQYGAGPIGSLPGEPGPAGKKGEPGMEGPKGETGIDGQLIADESDSGPVGPAGKPGPYGAEGESGEPGSDGAPSGDSVPGPIGDIGDQGESGSSGGVGDIGEEGTRGQSGDCSFCPPARFPPGYFEFSQTFELKRVF